LEKEEILRHEYFPQNNGDQYYKLHPVGSSHTRVTEQAVEQALLSELVKKALGPEKLSFRRIKVLRKWDKYRIVRLTRAAFRTGRHPAVWKRASGVVIRKPGNDAYSKLRAYGSISLLSCMGKVVEKLTTELLSEEGERMGLLSNGQFGSRKGQSAFDAATNMLDRAHASQIVLATGPNSRVGSGLGSTRNRTIATGIITRKTRTVGNGAVLPAKTRHFKSTIFAPIKYLSSDRIMT
jgi:hypothetical protein